MNPIVKAACNKVWRHECVHRHSTDAVEGVGAA